MSMDRDMAGTMVLKGRHGLCAITGCPKRAATTFKYEAIDIGFALCVDHGAYATRIERGMDILLSAPINHGNPGTYCHGDLECYLLDGHDGDHAHGE